MKKSRQCWLQKDQPIRLTWLKLPAHRRRRPSVLQAELCNANFEIFRMNGGPTLQKELSIAPTPVTTGDSTKPWKPYRSHLISQRAPYEVQIGKSCSPKILHTKPMVGALSHLQCLSHSPTIRVSPHPITASENTIGQDPNTARDAESHRTAEQWKSGRYWWHPTRDLEKWRSSIQYLTPRILRLHLGAGKTPTTSPWRSHYHPVQE